MRFAEAAQDWPRQRGGLQTAYAVQQRLAMEGVRFAEAVQD